MTDSNDERRRQGDLRLHQTLGRIEERLKHVDEATQDTKKYVQDVSARVRSLEVSRGWIVGAGAGAGGLVAWLLNILN